MTSGERPERGRGAGATRPLPTGISRGGVAGDQREAGDRRVSAIVRPVPSAPNAVAIEMATERLLRVAMLFGLAGSLVALATTVQQGASLATLLLALIWTLTWTALGSRPRLVIPILRRWRWAIPIVAVTSAATILATGGFDSPLKAEANWLAWAAPVLLGARASLAVAAILSSGLLSALLLTGVSLAATLSGPNRYTAVTDVLNPLIIALAALAVTGVFRVVLSNAVETLGRARRGDTASSPAMLALLARRPALALPVGDVALGSSSRALSAAERDIIERLADGETPQQIALSRGVRDDTVYDQIASAKDKAQATTIEHLIALAWRPST